MTDRNAAAESQRFCAEEKDKLAKKRYWVIPALLVVVLMLGVTKNRWDQQNAYETYFAFQAQLEKSVLTVTENGETVGTYKLEELGLLQPAIEAAEACFTDAEKLSHGEFSELTFLEKWSNLGVGREQAVTLKGEWLDPSAVLMDLKAMDRQPTTDAYIQLKDGVYAIVPEKFGTEVDEENIRQGLFEAIDGWKITPRKERRRAFEITDCSAYVLPSVTAEKLTLEAEQLMKHAADVTIPVKLLMQTVEVAAGPLVFLGETNTVQVDRAALEQLVEEWAALCPQGVTPYVLDSYGRGPVPLDFLGCHYELDRETLLQQLENQLLNLDSTLLKAPYFCTRNNAPYSLGDIYVEVDIARQKMVLYEKGEALVYTDVVTGLPAGRWTWPGLYAVDSLDTNRWLSGPDYNVYVDYWVGYNGDYGIHDAAWRQEFGGDLYLEDGSHGCVNTPTDAMKTIFEHMELGVPVVVHYQPMES